MEIFFVGDLLVNILIIQHRSPCNKRHRLIVFLNISIENFIISLEFKRGLFENYVLLQNSDFYVVFCFGSISSVFIYQADFSDNIISFEINTRNSIDS